MDINELESFKLSDAVKFNRTLNPKLWGRDEHLLPEVREKLMAIADDFREFLGVNGLDVKDITVSGSNAAYTYTPHSDIDLHLVVTMPEGKDSDVYRELFDAKKYQYNDQHNYKIGGYDVELYVQDADQVHHSQGIYSVLNNDWVSVPRRRQPEVDDISVQSKFEDIGHRIEQAIASGDPKQLEAIAAKVKNMRQAGLDTTGEFGPENLAFKALRTQGLLDQLRAARNAVKDQELSLQERKKKKKRAQRGYGGYWYPGFAFGDGEGGGDGGGGESVQENTKSPDIKQILQPFVDSCVEYLGIEQTPKIILKRDPEWTRRNGTFGRFDPDTYSVTLAVSGRHILDILRTLAHELTHARQDEQAEMPVDAGETGSPYEDEANAMAGRIMRHWVDQYPEFFKGIPLEEDYDPNGPPPGPETKPTMPAGTVKVDVSDVYDWYKLGQHISNLKGLGKHDFGAGPPSAILAFGDEDTEHKYIQDLEKTGLTTTDIDPVDPNQPAGMKRQKTDPTYNVNEAFDQPYKLKWEAGDYGDVDALAKLDDGTYLSIMFNKGYNQDKEEAWNVEFYRNNSQEVTGEGDAPRVFATVLSAIQTFIKKYKPNRVIFSASKEVEPGQNAQSRARLYDSLVQRYARAWGFRAFRADTGNKVIYELSRIQPVKEDTEHYNGIEISLEKDDDEILVKAMMAGGRELGHVLFVQEGDYLMPQDLEVDERYQGQGIAATMYDYVKSKGYKIRRSGQQTDAGAGFWAKHRPDQNVWEQRLAEASGYIPINDKEAQDPRYSMALTVDIKPGEVQRQAKKMGWKTDRAGHPPLLTSNASNLRESQDSNMKIAHVLKETTLGGFPVKVLNIQDQGVDEASPMIKPPANRFDNKQEAFAHAKQHGGQVFKSTYIDPNTGNKQISFVVKKEQGVAEGLDNPWGDQGNFAGDTPVNIGGDTVKRLGIGDTVTYLGQRAKIVGMSRDKTISRITIEKGMGSVTQDVRTSNLKRTHQDVAEAIKLNAPQRTIPRDELQGYADRIKTGTKTKRDKFAPIIHGSNIKAITKDDENTEWDLDDLASQITTRPKAILGTNAKMEKSKTEGEIIYDLTLPALSGIVVDEDTGDFVEITTCPGAGQCQLFCYARKGGYVMFPASSMSAAQALNFLVNDPEGYSARVNQEIKAVKARADKAGIQLVVRWHDAGDFFSKEYLDLAYDVARANPDVQFYAYTKMGDVATGATPANFTMNFSSGSKRGEEKKVEFYKQQNPGATVKQGVTVPKDMFFDLIARKGNSLIKDAKGRTQFSSPEALNTFKQRLAQQYRVAPDSIITYDQMLATPVGPTPKWNVIVQPGAGDRAANRKDVIDSYLMFH